MKRCPTCNRSYADNTLSFCLEDGTRLDDPEATVVAQPRPPAPPVAKPPRTKGHRVYLLILLWLLVVVVLGGIGLYVTLSKHNEQNEVVASPSPEPSRGDPLSLLNQNTQAKLLRVRLLASGFADQSHFTRVFKHCAGMTPSAFRTMVLSNNKIQRHVLPLFRHTR